ncbi:MAG: undecaprenyldiphospho-muramoylpentapeptide beta-N-acetylglucosaminyltransferase [Deltaproteobacteria bacterium]|jgi:UDP-N-acetylglucosamine--N-acetylmuramyl-(pentapeptide) pyrophosphoryl-undecaprenol N-acetylglucosamine transferase|nr:undecaprenyldiphospho-muramoylpentapeptide beta-N-acetylglucosaminyltransferase [Deltaproteobacteria bacterium]
MANIPKRFLMAAGATGGHIMPAVALIDTLREGLPDLEVLFVGVGREAEAKILDPLGFKRQVISGAGLKGHGVFKKGIGLLKTFKGYFEAFLIIRRFKPDVAFGTGSYAAGPVGLAAFTLRVPLFIHEQNRYPGLTNRFLGKFAKIIFLGEEDTVGFNPTKTVFTGNPVRAEIRALKDLPLPSLRRKPEDPFTLVVLGGSQGARKINETVLEIVSQLFESSKNLRLFHQAGNDGVKLCENIYQRFGEKITLKPFFTDMARLYSEADLIIARAGALTLAELAYAGVPAILIPLPTAADDHQTLNARAREAKGSAILIPESDLTGELLLNTLLNLLNSPQRLRDMAESTREFIPQKEANSSMANLILDFLRPVGPV